MEEFVERVLSDAARLRGYVRAMMVDVDAMAQRWARNKSRVIPALVGFGIPFVTAWLQFIDEDKPTTWFYVLLVLSVVLGWAAYRVPIWQSQEARERIVARSIRPPKRVRDVDPYAELGVPASSRERRDAGALPPYIPRSPYDERLHAALRDTRFALLVAPRGWGASRTALQAALHYHPDAPLVVPADAAALRTLMDLDPPWEPPGHGGSAVRLLA